MELSADFKDLLDALYNGPQHVVVGEYIVFVKVNPDETPDDPEEWGRGKILSFNSRHRNHVVGEDFEEMKEEYGPDIVPLSYFEHGRCLWGVAGTMSDMPDFRWDGCSYAGIWVPDDDLVKELTEGLSPKDRAKKLMTAAESYCEAYTQHCNGDVFYASVETFKVRRTEDGQVFDREEDYRFSDCVFDQGCGGLYGDEGVRDFLTETLGWLTTELQVTA